MHRNADRAGLVGNGAGDSLANPPGRVGGELEALAVVKLLHRLDQAQIPLLNQIQEQHPAAHIMLGDGHHQAQIGLGELALGFVALLLIFAFQLHGDGALLVGAEQGNLADFLEGVHILGIKNWDHSFPT